MQKQNAIHTLLFIIFFAIGASAFGASALLDEFIRYYQNRQALETARQHLQRLQSLYADYDALLQRLENDPNIIKRIAPATLGTELPDSNAAYPKPTPDQLAAIRQAFSEELNAEPAEPPIPKWLIRCSRPWRRFALFVAGAFLIFLSFICFRAG